MSFLIPRPGGFQATELMAVEEALCSKEERTLFLEGPITYSRDDLYSAEYLINALIVLDKISHEPIKLIISSLGGVIELGLLLYDTIQCINSPLYTVGRMNASMATIILASGRKGHRYIYPHSRTMLHLPVGGFEGDPKQVQRQIKEFDKFKDILIDIILKHGCTKSRTQILEDIDREFWLRGKEAVDYGLADEVITPEIHQELFGKPFKVKFPKRSRITTIKEVNGHKEGAPQEENSGEDE